MIPRRELAAGVACILLVGALGPALALRGWRSSVPSTDVIPYIDGAHALLSRAQLPDRGVVTSLASYAPPGLAWVILPGFALLSDPRMFDVPGVVLLHLGTLIGIFLLARTCFGVRCALFSVLVYGLSERGLMFAGSLGLGSAGPSGHPFFYVWMACWSYWWVARRDSRYLAAACLTWAVGMYVFMELAPAAVMVPVVWILYRPPVHLRPLALGVAVALLIWLPYLRFESARGFADIRSQLLVQDLTPAGYSNTRCDSTLTLRRWGGASIQPAADNPGPTTRTTRFVIWSGGRVLAATRGLVGNFEGLIPGARLALLALTIAGLIVLSLHPGRARSDPRDSATRFLYSRPWPTVAAIGLLIWAVVANDEVIDRVLGSRVRLGLFAITSIRILQGLTALGGIALLTRRFIARRLKTLASRLDSASCAPQVLAVALVVPWVVLLLVVEPGREDRLFGLWPLQVIVLAFVAVTLPPISGRTARLTGWLGAPVIAMLILINPFVVSRVEAWHQEGWSGRDAVEVQVADYLARRLQSEGRTQAVIGYRLFDDEPSAPPWRVADVRWKIGEEFDALLKYPRGISNLNRCVEGLSAQDEYRVVEVSPPSAAPAYYFDVPLPGRLRFLDRIGQYEVYERE